MYYKTYKKKKTLKNTIQYIYVALEMLNKKKKYNVWKKSNDTLFIV